jgi:hypothetical protein
MVPVEEASSLTKTDRACGVSYSDAKPLFVGGKKAGDD